MADRIVILSRNPSTGALVFTPADGLGILQPGDRVFTDYVGTQMGTIMDVSCDLSHATLIQTGHLARQEPFHG